MINEQWTFSEDEQYEVIYTNTRSKKTHKIYFYCKDENELKDKLSDIKFKNCIIHESKLSSPTEEQIKYAISLGISINFENITRKDLSNLIDITKCYWKIPHPQLLDFAKNRNIYLSKYITKASAYHNIFKSLNESDQIYFYVFCLYRWFTRDPIRNPDIHPYTKKFIEISKLLEIDPVFKKCFTRQNCGGEDFRVFRDLNTNQKKCYNYVKKQLIAFKVIDKRTIQIKEYEIEDDFSYSNKVENNKEINDIMTQKLIDKQLGNKQDNNNESEILTTKKEIFEKSYNIDKPMNIYIGQVENQAKEKGSNPYLFLAKISLPLAFAYLLLFFFLHN